MITALQLAAALRAAANALDGNSGTTQVVTTTAQPAATQPAADPMGGLGSLGGTTAPPAKTADELVALITPHVGDNAKKDRLGEIMRGMGYNGLPEIPADKYGAVFAAFETQIRAWGAAQPQANASII